MKSAKISMPLAVYLPRKTKADQKYIINLNNYRNWNFIVSNQVKKAYAKIAEPKIKDFKFYLPVELTFILWKRDRRLIDRANPLCIHEKFFCDALTTYGCIQDDNDDFIHSTHYYTGGIDRANPRVDIDIKEMPDA